MFSRVFFFIKSGPFILELDVVLGDLARPAMALVVVLPDSLLAFEIVNHSSAAFRHMDFDYLFAMPFNHGQIDGGDPDGTEANVLAPLANLRPLLRLDILNGRQVLHAIL